MTAQEHPVHRCVLLSSDDATALETDINDWLATTGGLVVSFRVILDPDGYLNAFLIYEDRS